MNTQHLHRDEMPWDSRGTATAPMRRASPLPVLLSLVIGATAYLYSGMAMAEEAASASEPALEEIVVTGSSIAQRADKSSVPVTILSAEDISKQAPTSASDLIQKLPAVQGFIASANSVNGGGGGQTTAALHALTSKYTVVLLDGQRMAQYNLNTGLGGGSAVNLESIPLEAIERVEVLTDGASALYGADAVAGVVNFILKKNHTEGNAYYRASIPDQHGGDGWSAGFSKGFGDLNSDNYNFLLTYSHDVQNALWAADRAVSRQGGFFPFSSGGTNYVFNVRTSNTEPANITLPSGLGAFNPFYTANTNCGNPNADVLTGSPTDITCRFNYAATVQDMAPSTRDAGLLRGTFKIGESSELWADAVVSRFVTTPQFAPPAQPLGVRPDRLGALWTKYVVPYLTANNITWVGDGTGCTSPTATVVGPNPCAMDARATLGYRAVSAGGRADEFVYQTRHLAAGLDTSLAGWDLKAALVASSGKFTDTAAGGFLDFDLFSNAVATGAYDPVLGTGQSALKAAILHTNFSTTYSNVNSLKLNAQHKLFDLQGGASVLSVGTEYTSTRFKTDFSDIARSGNGTVTQPNSTDSAVGGPGGSVNVDGTRTSWGLFGEWLLPFRNDLTATASARYDSYSKVHSTMIFDTSVPNPATGLYDQLPAGDLGNSFAQATYKLSFRYNPIEMLAIRGSIGTGFKVPEITDIAGTLSYAGSTAGSYLCPIPGAEGCLTGNAQYDLLLGPNGNSGPTGLKPEKSTQFTFGARVDPLQGLSLGIDYWNVHIKDQIQSAGISEQTAFNNPTQYAYLFVNPYLDPVGQYKTIGLKQIPFNGGEANYSGIDWNFSYDTNTGWGKFNAMWTGTYMLKQDYTYGPELPKNTDLGVFGPDNTVVFKTVSRLALTLQTGKWVNTLSANYRSGYTDIQHIGDGAVFLADPSNPNGFGANVDFCCLKVPAYTTLDWQSAYDIVKAVNLTFGVKNLTDKAPPLSLQNAGGGNQGGYDGRYADPLGRAYYFRINYKF
jgi:iron complex outermembrane recepter protein